ncbi:MAG: RraA family protein [Mesorhizobium sp.]
MSVRDLFENISTSSVSDALDKLGLPGPLKGIKPLSRGMRFIGEVFTVRFHAYGGKTPTSLGDYVDSVPAGTVVVIDNGGRDDCSVWGDILTSVAVNRQIAGTVIDGVCRDAERIVDLGYPMFTRGHFMRTGGYRAEIAQLNGVVSIAGVRVEPGDIAVADYDGVVIVPRLMTELVAAESRTIEDRDAGILNRIAAGKSLADAKVG